MIDHIITAAKLGGEQINKYFGEILEISRKSSLADFRTQADLASEKAILNELQKYFPNYNYLAEESGWKKNDSPFTFVIDPLDGTNNFSLGISNFSVSIGLQKGDETIAGVIYNPTTHQVYYAEKGKGAYLDGIKIQTNNVSDIQNATISYVCGYDNDGTIYEDLVSGMNIRKGKRLLTNWSVALDHCLLANGRIEAIICNGTEVYDNIAGKIIVKEAGGIITKFNGQKEENDENAYFIVSNNQIFHKEIVDLCSSIKNLK